MLELITMFICLLLYNYGRNEIDLALLIQTNNKDRRPILLVVQSNLALIWHPGRVGGALHLDSATADVNLAILLLSLSRSCPLPCGNVSYDSVK